MGRREQSVVDLAKTGVREMPRNAAWALSKVVRTAGHAIDSGSDTVVDQGRRAARRAASAVGASDSDGSVESLLRRADEAAEIARAAEADAVQRAEEAKAAAEFAQHTAREAEEELAAAEKEGQKAVKEHVAAVEGEAREMVQRVQQEAKDMVERARSDLESAVSEELDDLRSELDSDVDQARERAQSSAAEAREALARADEAVTVARDLATQAQSAAERAAAEAAQTAERLRWEEREKVTIGAPLREEDLIDLTKAELIDLASTAEVPGRSHMSKSELVSALSSQTTVKP